MGWRFSALILRLLFLSPFTHHSQNCEQDLILLFYLLQPFLVPALCLILYKNSLPFGKESPGAVHLHACICVYEPGRVEGDSKLAKYGSRGSGFLSELIMENGEFHLQVSDWIWSRFSLSALRDYLVDRSWDLGPPLKMPLVSKYSPSLLVAQFHATLLGQRFSTNLPLLIGNEKLIPTDLTFSHTWNERIKGKW